MPAPPHMLSGLLLRGGLFALFGFQRGQFFFDLGDRYRTRDALAIGENECRRALDVQAAAEFDDD